MAIILKKTNTDFPFNWANLNSYRESTAIRKEIYLKEHNNLLYDLKHLFYLLFGKSKSKLIIYNKSWWNFCLDTWDIDNDDNNYSLDGKSFESQEYLKILRESELLVNYSGCCECIEWDVFLNVILKCVINHRAPYSPLFCDIEKNYFFYFHHTGSIGIYYKEENDAIKQILSNAVKKYIVLD